MGAEETFRLRNGEDEAIVARRGGELLSWRVAGRDLLWTPDTAVWTRTSPILFPIVGWAAGGVIRVEGQEYPIGVHGFAAETDFAPVSTGEDFVRLRLSDNDATLAAFPFRFRLEVEYRLRPGGLDIGFTVSNPGESPLPYALGFHPGFRWPFSGAGREAHRVEFDAPEETSVPEITARGLFSATRRALGFDGRTLALTDALLAREALCFLDANSRAVRFVAPDGAVIGMAVEDFPHLALWSRPPAPFLSIEAWTGHGDPDGFAGEIGDKPSMRWLAPGAVARHGVALSFSAA